jgi:hypothetical protein
MKGLMQQLQDDNRREYVIQTGSAGMKMFDDSMFEIGVVKPVRKKLTKLYNKNLVNKDEYDNLTKMIDSVD